MYAREGILIDFSSFLQMKPAIIILWKKKNLKKTITWFALWYINKQNKISKLIKQPIATKQNKLFKDWSQFSFGSWRNKLKNVVHIGEPHFWVYFEWTQKNCDVYHIFEFISSWTEKKLRSILIN